MKRLTYYLVLLIIRLKKTKLVFSKEPVDYLKLRMEDVKAPRTGKAGSLRIRNFKIKESEVTEFTPESKTERLIIFVPGGAFVYGPVGYHWKAAQKISRSGNLVWLVNYPKAPENGIDRIAENIEKVYETAIELYSSKKIILIGDSVGGTLLTSLVQKLIIRKFRIPVFLILISPVMDASLTNPRIRELDPKDPILSRTGVLSAKKMASGGRDLKDPLLSPLSGSFKNFPRTLLFIADNDITRPDQELAAQKMNSEKVNIEIILGKGMPHIWPLLPVMIDGKIAFKKIIQRIDSFS